MPELHELCEKSSVVMPIELGSLEASYVAMTPSPPPSGPCQSPAFVDSGGVLASNSEALFGKEIYDLLVSLEAVSTGYGKKITSVLARNASDDIIRKVEKSLSKEKIWGVTRKAFAAR
jgi:hypothetical protein